MCGFWNQDRNDIGQKQKFDASIMTTSYEKMARTKLKSMLTPLAKTNASVKVKFPRSFSKKSQLP